MGELLDWKHFFKPIRESDMTVSFALSIFLSTYYYYVFKCQDGALIEASDKITFVFQTETNADH